MSKLVDILKGEKYKLNSVFINGQDWFMVSDIVTLLDVKIKVIEMVRKISEDNKRQIKMNVNSKAQERDIWYFNENGIKEILVKSTKPNAYDLINEVGKLEFEQFFINKKEKSNINKSKSYIKTQSNNASWNRNYKDNRIKSNLPVCCDICGWDCYGEYGIIELHHIEYLKNGGENNYKNLVMLCPNHHALLHKLSKNDNYKNKLYTKNLIIKNIIKYENENINLKNNINLPDSIISNGIKFIITNEFRPPKINEWYLYAIGNKSYIAYKSLFDMKQCRIIIHPETNS